MTQELILIRGLPGSGKSTLAKTLLSFDGYDYQDIGWFETDMFFYQPKVPIDDLYHEDKVEGLKCGFWNEQYEYIFDGSKIKEAHNWCQSKVKEYLSKKGNRTCIVSNTFTRIWEMKPYIDMAKKFGAKLTVLTCEGNHGNVHNVPQEKIQEMRLRWEKYDG